MSKIKDFSVWTNAFYLLKAIPGLLFYTMPEAFLMVLTGTNLAVFSAGFHTERGRWWQKMDVWSMITYMATIAFIVAANAVSYWIYLGFPFVAWDYFRKRKTFSSTTHVVGWTVVIAFLLYVSVGWWVILPISIFLIAAAIKLFERRLESWTTHGTAHGFWHVFSGLAGSQAVAVLFESYQSLLSGPFI